MAQAMRLAMQGQYSCQPNPRVGCVIVQGNKIVGTGSHIQAGREHAEINALHEAGARSKGSSCYISLEPCVHTGRTPPCTDALINAGIKTVFAAMIDPNPRVNGQGLAKIMQHGIKTHTGLLENEARLLNKGYIKRMQENRPYVRCKLAMSLDGKTALASGVSKWISGEQARHDVQKIRAASCAVLTGIGTVLTDDPMLSVREIDTMGRQPVRVVIDRKLQIPVNANVLQADGDVIIFTTTKNNKRTQLLIAEGVQVVKIDDTDGFLDTCLEHLASVLEINEVLVEAGAGLAGAFIEAGLVDELVLYQAPIILGDKALNLFNVSEVKNMAENYRLKLLDVRYIGDDLRLMYAFNK
jgi:diaminohydroxyphosphoribosylaminopyrimidine deaminase / 5-amino-6-(5-phosphoribosylamino)uracil reductase